VSASRSPIVRNATTVPRSRHYLGRSDGQLQPPPPGWRKPRVHTRPRLRPARPACGGSAGGPTLAPPRPWWRGAARRSSRGAPPDRCRVARRDARDRTLRGSRSYSSRRGCGAPPLRRWADDEAKALSRATAWPSPSGGPRRGRRYTSGDRRRRRCGGRSTCEASCLRRRPRSCRIRSNERARWGERKAAAWAYARCVPSGRTPFSAERRKPWIRKRHVREEVRGYQARARRPSEKREWPTLS
jgi:hypothetical protein